MLIPGFDPHGFFTNMSQRERMVRHLEGGGLGSSGLMSVTHAGLGYVGVLAATSAPATAMLGVLRTKGALPTHVFTKPTTATSVCTGVVCPTGQQCDPTSGGCIPSKGVVQTNQPITFTTMSLPTPSRSVAQTTPTGSSLPAPVTNTATMSTPNVNPATDTDPDAGNPDAAGSTYATGTDVDPSTVQSADSGATAAAQQAEQDAINAAAASSDSSGGGTDDSGSTDTSTSADTATVAATTAAAAALAPATSTSFFDSIPGWAWGIGGVAVAGIAFKMLSGKK